MLLLGGHGKAGCAGYLHKGVKAHQVAQNQVHIHRAGGVAAVDAAGVRPAAGSGADALGQGVHLRHPAVQITPGKGVGQTHGRFVCVAGKHGVHGLAVGKSLVGAHICVVRLENIVRDSKRHLEGAVQLVGVVGQQHSKGHIFCQTAGRYLLCAVLIIDNDVGIRVHDIGACSLHLIHRAGVEHGPGGQHKAAEQEYKGKNQCKNTFHVDNSFKKR